MDFGVLVARLVLGLAIAAHGAQKLWGWFGGYGFKGTTSFMASLGYRPAGLFTLAVGAGEVAGGILTATGLLGPVGPALILLCMVVAAAVVHWSGGFFATTNGVELPVLYATAALALASAGPGVYALDTALGLQALSSPGVVGPVLAAAVAGALLSIAARRAPAHTAPVAG
jgi:putative oxidoreductase